MGDNNNSKGEWWNWDPKITFFQSSNVCGTILDTTLAFGNNHLPNFEGFLSILRENISQMHKYASNRASFGEVYQHIESVGESRDGP